MASKFDYPNRGDRIVPDGSGVVFAGFANSDLADKTHDINTKHKEAGKVVFDSTNGILVVAQGSADTDGWAPTDGSTATTPA